MKHAIIVLALILQLIPSSYGQTFASVPQAEFTPYSQANFTNYSYHSHMGGAKLAGGIIAFSGMTAGFLGVFFYAVSAGGGSESDPPNYDMQNIGVELMIAGGAMIIGGCALGIGGIIHDHKRYGLHIIAPKKNEIGLAYNF